MQCLTGGGASEGSPAQSLAGLGPGECTCSTARVSSSYSELMPARAVAA